jgi:hypothetical protein
MNYKILFDEDASYEYKFKVLDCLISWYILGNTSLTFIAELNKSVVHFDNAKMEATFTRENGFIE